MWDVGASYSNGPRLSVCPSVCHTRISPKLSEIDAWLLGNSNRNPGFPIQNLYQSRDRKYGSAILGVSGLALRPFRQKWAVGLVNGSVGTVTSLDTWPALPVSSCTSCASSYAQLHWKKEEHNHTGHCGEPAIVTSHNGRYLVIQLQSNTQSFIHQRW